MKNFILLLGLLIFFVGYSSAAKLWFESDQESVVANCPNIVKVMLDTEGKMTTAIDLRMTIDGASDSIFFDGQGGLFKQYTLPKIEFIDNRLTAYILLSTMSRWGVNSSGQLGSLTFVPSSSATFVRLSFLIVPGQDEGDSSVIVVEDGNASDVLTSSIDLLLPVIQGSCNEEEKVDAIIESVQTGSVVLIENSDYHSQYKGQENRDVFMAWFVRNIDIILWVFALFIFLLLLRVFYISKFFHKRAIHKKQE